MRTKMAKTITPAKTDRQEQILDLAAGLIQTCGYNGFSYQDIADALGIRKASIHYYFPSKSSLGLAAINRYAEQIGHALKTLEDDETLSARTMIGRYFDALLQIAKDSENFCLAGALAAELMVLPADIRSSVNHFFQDQQAWLTRTIERGITGGEIHSTLPAGQMARLIFSAAEGALLIKRTSGDVQQMADVTGALTQQLFGIEEEHQS